MEDAAFVLLLFLFSHKMNAVLVGLVACAAYGYFVYFNPVSNVSLYNTSESYFALSADGTFWTWSDGEKPMIHPYIRDPIDVCMIRGWTCFVTEM